MPWESIFYLWENISYLQAAFSITGIRLPVFPSDEKLVPAQFWFHPFVNWRKMIIQMTMFVFDALLVGLPVAPYGEKLVPAHFLPVEHFLSFKHFLSLKHFLSSPFNSFSWDSYQGDSDAHFFCLWCAQLGFPVFDPANLLSLPFMCFCGGKWWFRWRCLIKQCVIWWLRTLVFVFDWCWPSWTVDPSKVWWIVVVDNEDDLMIMVMHHWR